MSDKGFIPFNQSVQCAADASPSCQRFCVCLVTRSPEMSQPWEHIEREGERERQWATEPNIFHPVNRSRNPNSREKVSCCQSNQSLRKHPTQRSSRHNCQLPRRRRSQIAQIHEPCGKNGCSYSSNGNLACAAQLFNTFFVFMASLSVQISRHRGAGGRAGEGEVCRGRASGAVNCAGVLIQSCNVHAGLMLQQQRRYGCCGDFMQLVLQWNWNSTTFFLNIIKFITAAKCRNSV